MTNLATFVVQEFDGYRVFIAKGEIDIGNAAEFKTALQDAAPAGSEALIISLTDIKYLDSNALAVLIDVTRRFGVSRRQMGVVCPRDSASGKIVRTAGLHNVIPMFESTDEAVTGIVAL